MWNVDVIINVDNWLNIPKFQLVEVGMLFKVVFFRKCYNLQPSQGHSERNCTCTHSKKTRLLERGVPCMDVYVFFVNVKMCSHLRNFKNVRRFLGGVLDTWEV